MGTRAVLQAFERYQRERVAFAAGVAEMAKGPQVPPSAAQPPRALQHRPQSGLPPRVRPVTEER
jgi:hypothetical protein